MSFLGKVQRASHHQTEVTTSQSAEYIPTFVWQVLCFARTSKHSDVCVLGIYFTEIQGYVSIL